MIKVAIIGTGMIARSAHIPAYRNRADVFSVEAVFDLNEERARSTAQDFGIPHAFTDIEALLEAIRPDLVSICVPNQFHKEYARIALSYGAHVLCEKPLVFTYADAKELYALAEKQGKHLICCQSMRYTPDKLAAKQYIQQGLLGDLYFSSFSRIRRRGIPTWGTFHIKEYSGGGAMMDIGIHQLDAMLWLMGTPAIASVSGVISQNHVGEIGDLISSGARTGTIAHTRNFDPAEMDVEDFATGMIRFQNGAIAHITAAWSANMEDSTTMQLVGKKSGLSLPDGALLRGSDINTALEIPTDPYAKEAFPGHFHIIDNLAEVFRHDAAPEILPQETLQVCAVLDLFYRSAALGRDVRPEELEMA